MSGTVRRTLERYLKQASKAFPALLVTGARQVGKTTLLRLAAGAGREYVTLDDPGERQLALTDPALFLNRHPAPVLVDEIQYAPGLLPYLKMAIDERSTTGKVAAGMFWLTGSQQFHLMQGVSESLAGRVAVLDLLGLSRREALGKATEVVPFEHPAQCPRTVKGAALDPAALYALIWRGSMPGVALRPEVDWAMFQASYVRTYLERDLRDLARVGDETAFLTFLRAAAARTGQVLNLSELARDCSLSTNTAKAWLSMLVTSGLVYLLEPWSTNLHSRIIKTPKLYFLDTGLCCWLTGWSSPEVLAMGAMSGAILETWVVAEILKSHLHNGRRPQLHYYRDRDGHEVDLLLFQDGQLLPVEIKRTASPSPRDLKHIDWLRKRDLPVGPGAVLCLAPKPLPLSPTDNAIPVWAI